LLRARARFCVAYDPANARVTDIEAFTNRAYRTATYERINGRVTCCVRGRISHINARCSETP
jgi:hypothetical protein